MRRSVLPILCFIFLALCGLVGAWTASEPAAVRIKLIDAENGEPIAGLVRVTAKGEREPVALPGLYDRLRGLGRRKEGSGWYVVPVSGGETRLPRGEYRVEALAGLESALARAKLVVGSEPVATTITLTPLFRPRELGLAIGNTHLHLRNLSFDEAKEYLRQIPPAENLDVLFLSYLERKNDDKSYVSNQFPIGPLPEFDATGVRIANGEEHRNNFLENTEGYGHVMLLGIKELVKPVSIGPGIMREGYDDQPLAVGMQQAREQGGTVVWCHNIRGYEDVPSALAGRLDAFNVFDGTGSRETSYEEDYYRFLNVGLEMPISTGTDWFLYDFSRVYVRLAEPITPVRWLEALRAGGSVATNGPLLTLTVAGKSIGERIDLGGPGRLRVTATGIGRCDFGRLELIHNGTVLQAEPARAAADGFAAQIERDVPVDAPGWFAVRVKASKQNELGNPIFAHSSPVYVTISGRRPFDLEAAQGLLKLIDEAQGQVRARGTFSTPEAQAKVLEVYNRAAEELLGRIRRRE